MIPEESTPLWLLLVYAAAVGLLVVSMLALSAVLGQRHRDLGLPGLGNFVAEFLTLVGAFRVNPVITIIAAVGFVVATVYALRLVQQVFHGANPEHWQLADFSLREMVVMGMMIVSLVWLGLFPRPVLDTAKPALSRLQHGAAEPESSGRSSHDTR